MIPPYLLSSGSSSNANSICDCNAGIFIIKDKVATPDLRKGRLKVNKSGSNIIVTWEDLHSGKKEINLTLQPGYASFIKQKNRVFKLTITSNNTSQYFWMQEKDESLDDDIVKKVSESLSLGNNEYVGNMGGVNPDTLYNIGRKKDITTRKIKDKEQMSQTLFNTNIEYTENGNITNWCQHTTSILLDKGISLSNQDVKYIKYNKTDTSIDKIFKNDNIDYNILLKNDNTLTLKLSISNTSSNIINVNPIFEFNFININDILIGNDIDSLKHIPLDTSINKDAMTDPYISINGKGYSISLSCICQYSIKTDDEGIVQLGNGEIDVGLEDKVIKIGIINNKYELDISMIQSVEITLKQNKN